MPSERKKLLLRLDPAVHDALARWASDELRSTNAQIEFVLRRALGETGRLPGNVGRIRRPGRPRADDTGDTPSDPIGDTPSDDTENEPSHHTGPRSSDHPERTSNANHEEP